MSDTVLDESILTEIAEKGVIFGHKKSKTHPLMKSLIIDTRNEIDLLSPEAVIESLNKAIEFLKEKSKGGMLALLVGTSPPAKEAVKNFARHFDFPYVVSRWLGGTLTNFAVIQKRNLYYQDLILKQEKGELAKYTKKEQLDFSREIEKLRENFEGLVRLIRVPDVLIVVDIKEQETAVREAKHVGIPVVAIIDSDDNPTLVQYPIFGSDHGKLSIEWLLGKIQASLPVPTGEVPPVAA